MFSKAKRYLTSRLLSTLEPRKLAAISEAKTLKTFRRAARHIPAYRAYLSEMNLDPDRIKTISDFQTSVPLTDKDRTFRLYTMEIKKLCLLGEIKDVRTIVSSSGHSGCFSYGLNTQKELKIHQEAIDFMLTEYFNVDRKKTLLINALPMGVKVHSSIVTVVDTSVRTDIVAGVVRTFAPCYDQTIIIGENSFVKATLEEGAAAGLLWRDHAVHLILGEEILPENLRTYLAGLLGFDPDDTSASRLIGSSFGVAEFGLNVFYESRELIRLRRLLHRDVKFKMALLGREPDALPGLFQYNPMRVFVEETKDAEGMPHIVLTNLEEDTNLPLIRYNIKDEGRSISFGRLKETLEAFDYGEYLPRVRLPLVAVWGRDRIPLGDGKSLRPESVKELLYSDVEIARAITGYFRLSFNEAGSLKVEVQLKPYLSAASGMESRLRDILAPRIGARSEIILYPYRDFPYGMELNFEKKFQYI